MKGKKLFKALGLALALFAFAPLGTTVVWPQTSPWWPWLTRMFMAAPVLLAALVTGVLLRPQRPEPLAAKIAASVGLAIILVQISLDHNNFWPYLGQLIFVPGSVGFSEGTLGDQLRFSVMQGMQEVLTYSLGFILPLAASCWVAANFWRTVSWRQFWSGPGGAIIKGGLAVAIVTFPLRLGQNWYRNSYAIPRYAAEMARLGHEFRLPSDFHRLALIRLCLFSLHEIAIGAGLTALLVRYRPSLKLGAFAGSGIMLGYIAISQAIYHLTFPPSATTEPRFASPFDLMLLTTLVSAITGAVAGVFAGRWSEEAVELHVERP